MTTINKTQFNAEVTKLIERTDAGGFNSREDRITEIDRLINAYIENTGEIPPSDDLERLTDEILREELKDMDEHKMSRHEYPIMSERQALRRKERQSSERAYTVYGTDGKNYGPRKRRKRTKYENNQLDKGVRAVNKERKRQYRIDTAPGEVITYSLPPEELSMYLEEKYGRKLHI